MVDIEIWMGNQINVWKINLKLQAVEIIETEFSYVIIPAGAQRFPVSYQERKVKWKKKKGRSQSTET